LEAFRADKVFVGPHNRPDVEEGFAQLDFAPSARPVGEEGIAENGHQLAALCRAHEINHLVYVGFAINWCLLMSPGGMVDMHCYGVMCSTIREAVTAVENRETAREEREKQQALWRVALEFGFVFGVDNFIGALGAVRAGTSS
jgi:nicotinamidase-related amidase